MLRECYCGSSDINLIESTEDGQYVGYYQCQDLECGVPAPTVKTRYPTHVPGLAENAWNATIAAVANSYGIPSLSDLIVAFPLKSDSELRDIIHESFLQARAKHLL